MPFRALPPSAAWQHRDARAGFEVAYFERRGGTQVIRGCTTGLENGRSWIVDYSIELDSAGTTRLAHIRGQSEAGIREIILTRNDSGMWFVGGGEAQLFDGCLDVDLESSAMTNALPVRRMRLAVGEQADAPAVYVTAEDLWLNRLEQSYVRVENEDGHQRYDYRAPMFDYAGRITYDRAGLVVDYPGIAVRAS